MIAAILALLAAVLLAVGYFADVPVLGWVAIATAAAALVALLLPSLLAKDGSTPPPAEPKPEPEPEPEPEQEPEPAPEPETSTDELVLVVAGRRRYHRVGCELLAGHQVEELTVDEAREEGFTACTRCEK